MTAFTFFKRDPVFLFSPFYSSKLRLSWYFGFSCCRFPLRSPPVFSMRETLQISDILNSASGLSPLVVSSQIDVARIVHEKSELTLSSVAENFTSGYSSEWSADQSGKTKRTCLIWSTLRASQQFSCLRAQRFCVVLQIDKHALKSPLRETIRLTYAEICFIQSKYWARHGTVFRR